MQFIRKLLFFVVVVLVQVLVCNNIHLFDYAMPMIYIYFLMLFRRDYPRWGILLWCFALGLTLDTFSNTPGVASASATLIGFLQPYIFAPFIQRDNLDDMVPDMRSMGFSKYEYIGERCAASDGEQPFHPVEEAEHLERIEHEAIDEHYHQ